jgi:hypothetical protein
MGAGQGAATSRVSLRGGFRVQVDIEDGWSLGADGCPLRLACERTRSTSTAFQADEERGWCVSSSDEVGGGGALRSNVTEGAGCSKLQRISIALAPEALGADLRQALDVGA